MGTAPSTYLNVHDIEAGRYGAVAEAGPAPPAEPPSPVHPPAGVVLEEGDPRDDDDNDDDRAQAGLLRHAVRLPAAAVMQGVGLALRAGRRYFGVQLVEGLPALPPPEPTFQCPICLEQTVLSDAASLHPDDHEAPVYIHHRFRRGQRGRRLHAVAAAAAAAAGVNAGAVDPADFAAAAAPVDVANAAAGGGGGAPQVPGAGAAAAPPAAAAVYANNGHDDGGGGGRDRHRCCASCMRAHLTARVLSGAEDARCPMMLPPLARNGLPRACPAAATEEQLMRLCGTEIVTRQRRFTLQRANPNYRDCPACHCLVLGDPAAGGGMVVCGGGNGGGKGGNSGGTGGMIGGGVAGGDGNGSGGGGSANDCGNSGGGGTDAGEGGCGTVFCFRHSNAHAPTAVACREYERRTRQLEEANRRAVALNSRPCPGCKAPTQHNGGCNHMTCSRCGHEWCWLCRRQFTGMDHYRADNIIGCPDMAFSQGPRAAGDGPLSTETVIRFFRLLVATRVVMLMAIGMIMFVAFAIALIAALVGLPAILVICALCQWLGGDHAVRVIFAVLLLPPLCLVVLANYAVAAAYVALNVAVAVTAVPLWAPLVCADRLRCSDIIEVVTYPVVFLNMLDGMNQFTARNLAAI